MARPREQDAPPPDLEAFAARLGHAFARPLLLRQALTHRSAADPRTGQLDSNERLEFIGDRVLALVIAEWLAERFPKEREGDLGRRLGSLVAWDKLARVAQGLDLGAALLVPSGEGRAGTHRRDNVLADALEAVLGALFQDGGLDAARPVIRRLWMPLLEADLKPPVAAKNRLQEWLAARGLPPPEYRVVSHAGPDHQPVFVVAVAAMGRDAEGIGDTKRAAEQAAAEAWMRGLARPELAKSGLALP